MTASLQMEDRSLDLEEDQRGAILDLQSSIQDLWTRRRPSSVDPQERHRGSTKSCHSRPPKPVSLSPKCLYTDDDMQLTQATEAPSEWTEECPNIDDEPRSQSRDRGRGLFGGLSRKFRNSQSKLSSDQDQQEWNLEGSLACSDSRASFRSVMSADSSERQSRTEVHQTKPFLQQQVDSLRGARTTRREAKKTALEESLMQQLAMMKEEFDKEAEEMSLKLSQREAAINTLEKALSLQTTTVENLRDELQEVHSRLSAAELKIKKYERKEKKKEESCVSQIPPEPGLGSRRLLKERHGKSAKEVNHQRMAKAASEDIELDFSVNYQAGRGSGKLKKLNSESSLKITSLSRRNSKSEVSHHQREDRSRSPGRYIDKHLCADYNRRSENSRSTEEPRRATSGHVNQSRPARRSSDLVTGARPSTLNDNVKSDERLLMQMKKLDSIEKSHFSREPRSRSVLETRISNNDCDKIHSDKKERTQRRSSANDRTTAPRAEGRIPVRLIDRRSSGPR